MNLKCKMPPKKVLISRLLQAILPMLVLGIILSAGGKVRREKLGPDAEVYHVKATVTDIPVDFSTEEFSGHQQVEAKITSGKFKGETCLLENANSYHIGAYCKEGTKIVAMVVPQGEKLVGSVYNYDRTGMVWLLLGLFALSAIAVGGFKGVAALYALSFTFVCVLGMYIPMLYAGFNGITAAIATSVTILAASIYILNGWSMKTLCAILGTSVGVAVSGLLAMWVGRAFHLSGFNMETSEGMLYIANHSKLKLGDILYAGVLISSLGAVMDVSVSMVAAMDEVRLHAPGMKSKALFLSGLRVGRDMIGTMSNTLILAYTGSATAVLLNNYAYERTSLYILSHNPVLTEILCGLCGTIGVILTVPIQAAITTALLTNRKK